jgi:peptidyl-prolyl cis-trans isomerase A (cyclophilin A)
MKIAAAPRRIVAGALLLTVLAFGGCATAPAQQPLPPRQQVQAGPHPRVRLETSQGDIVLELDHERAPRSVDNFLDYVAEKHYDGTVFHRVVAGFVIQGGGYDSSLADRPRYPPIPLEAGNGLHNLRGTVAMARGAPPDSADCEFYINLGDNLKLDPHPEIPGREHGYAVFGRVVEGMDTVDRIAALPVHAVNADMSNVPVPAVVIRSAQLLQGP